MTHPGPVAGEATGAIGGVFAHVELLRLVTMGVIGAEGELAGLGGGG